MIARHAAICSGVSQPTGLTGIAFHCAEQPTAKYIWLHLARSIFASIPFLMGEAFRRGKSLQMGVPVICKLGRSACSRAGGAIAKAVGLDDWVAEDDDGYIAIARRFADLPVELRTLRAELPAKVASSNAGNNEFYTRCVEAGYRQFWRRYCATQG